MIETSEFSRRSQDLRIQQQFFLTRSKITKSRKNCVDKIQDPLDPSTKCQARVQDPSRSRILDPVSFLDVGTCLQVQMNDRLDMFL